MELKREIGAAGNGIELFFQDFKGSDFDDKVEELKDFAALVTLKDLQEGVGSAGHRHGAWLDERSLTFEKRENKNPLSTTELYHRLQIPVRETP